VQEPVLLGEVLAEREFDLDLAGCDARQASPEG